MGGTTIPPFLVFKGHTHTERMWEEAREALGDCAIGLSENSWSNQEIGLKWLKHFKHYTRRTKV
ncbi:uncharacterized protein K441DRAFT_733820 [Cenococcum geophilum 1.58]|uniref:uncharacterized protein n=1 Tax=Cenococcum geophilum 1.58 TaxID=794803 RepID=UPI00358FA4A0|nr:hypothetical protein K441DRAFT_733820 [Cenococcum geophilum 1.58]